MVLRKRSQQAAPLPALASSVLRLGGELTSQLQELRRQRALNSQLLDAVLGPSGLETIAKLLGDGAEADAACGPSGTSALQLCALRGGGAEAAALLLDRGAQPLHRNRTGCTALHLAAHAGDAQLIQLLLDKVKEPVKRRALLEARTREDQGDSPDTPAISAWSDSWDHAHDAVTAALPDLPLGCTALHVACLRPKLRCLQLLTAAGADRSALDAQGRSPVEVLLLEGGEEQGGEEVVGPFLALLAEDRPGLSLALHAAASHGRLTLLEGLLSRDPAAASAPAKEETPVHAALRARDLQALRQLLRSDPGGLEAADSVGCRALQLAARLGWRDGARELLEAGAGLAARDTAGGIITTALHEATDAHLLGELFCVEEAYQLLNAERRDGLTPLAAALESRCPERVRLLLDAGADPDRVLSGGLAPLHLAARVGQPDLLQLLLRCCDPAVRTAELGATALHLAAQAGHTEAVRLLVERDLALVSCRDLRGWQAVHSAAQGGHRNALRLLLRAGGDLAAKALVEAKGRRRSWDSALSMLLHSLPEPAAFLEELLDESVVLKQRADQQQHLAKDVEIDVMYDILAPQDKVRGTDEQQMRVISAIASSEKCFGLHALLQHPLVDSFLDLKWKKMRRLIVVISFLTLAYICCFSVFVVNIYGYNNQKNSIKMTGLALSVYIICAILLSLECFCFMRSKWKYIRDFENWLKLISMVSAIVVTCFVTGDDNQADARWLRSASAVVVLLAFLQLLLLTRRFPLVGYQVIMFYTVVWNVIKMLILFSFLLVGFAVSFSLQFSQDPFQTPWESAGKTVVMATGEFDYGSMFDNVSEPLDKVMTRVLFFVFLLLVPVALMNLLVGLASNDIAGLEKHGRIRMLLQQAEFLRYLEELWLTRFCSVKLIFGDYMAVTTRVTIYPSKPPSATGNKVFHREIWEQIVQLATRKHAEKIAECSKENENKNILDEISLLRCELESSKNEISLMRDELRELRAASRQ